MVCHSWSDMYWPLGSTWAVHFVEDSFRQSHLLSCLKWKKYGLLCLQGDCVYTYKYYKLYCNTGPLTFLLIGWYACSTFLTFVWLVTITVITYQHLNYAAWRDKLPENSPKHNQFFHFIDTSHPGHRLFTLLPSGRRLRTSGSRNTPFPVAVHLLNFV